MKTSYGDCPINGFEEGRKFWHIMLINRRFFNEFQMKKRRKKKNRLAKGNQSQDPKLALTSICGNS